MQELMKQDPVDNSDPKTLITELLAVIDRANHGDKAGLATVRQLLKEDQALAINILGGDLARQTETKLVGIIAGEQLAFREGLLAQVDALRTELGGKTSNIVERLLVEC